MAALRRLGVPWVCSAPASHVAKCRARCGPLDGYPAREWVRPRRPACTKQGSRPGSAPTSLGGVFARRLSLARVLGLQIRCNPPQSPPPPGCTASLVGGLRAGPNVDVPTMSESASPFERSGRPRASGEHELSHLVRKLANICLDPAFRKSHCGATELPTTSRHVRLAAMSPARAAHLCLLGRRLRRRRLPLPLAIERLGRGALLRRRLAGRAAPCTPFACASPVSLGDGSGHCAKRCCCSLHPWLAARFDCREGDILEQQLLPKLAGSVPLAVAVPAPGRRALRGQLQCANVRCCSPARLPQGPPLSLR